MLEKKSFYLLLPFTLWLTACDDSQQPPPPQSQEELMAKAVPINSKTETALNQETEALKAKRAESKAELEKIRQQAASLNERADALQKGDLVTASSGNTPDASIATAAASEKNKQPADVPSQGPSSKSLEDQLISFNLKRLCESADYQMDVSGKKSVSHADLVGPGKAMPSLPSLAGENYEKLVFTPEQKTYQVTTSDGRVISFTRTK